jgi:hypothetical protein
MCAAYSFNPKPEGEGVTARSKANHGCVFGYAFNDLTPRKALTDAGHQWNSHRFREAVLPRKSRARRDCPCHQVDRFGLQLSLLTQRPVCRERVVDL